MVEAFLNMKYLLSSGRVTSDKIEYIKDLITILMYLDPQDIPYTNDGSKSLIEAIKSDDVEGSVRSIVTNLLNTVKSRFKDTTIDIGSVSIHNNLIRVEISINGVKNYYDIQG